MIPFWDPTSMLKDAYNAIFGLFTQLLSASINFNGLSIVQWMYENAAGFGAYIAFVVLLLVIPGFVFVRRMRLSGTLAAAMFILGPTLAIAWFLFISVLDGAGDGLTRLASTVGASPVGEGQLLNVPPVPLSNIVLDIGQLVSLIFLGGVHLQVAISFEMFNIVFAVLGLLVLSAYGLGPRTRQLFSILIALGLTTLLLGRPLVLLVIRFGNWVGSLIPVESVFWVGMVTSASMSLALLLVILLPFALYKATHRVLGSMIASVNNLVRSRIENKHKVDANVSGKVGSTASNRAHNVSRGSRYATQMKNEARRYAGNTASESLMRITKQSAQTAGAATAAAGAGKVAVSALSNLHPVAKVAVLGAGVAAKGIANAQPKTRKEGRGRDAYR